MKNVIGARIKRLKRAEQKEGEGICQGIGLFVAEPKDAERLRDRLIILNNPCDHTCLRWLLRIKENLEGMCPAHFLAAWFNSPSGSEYHSVRTHTCSKLRID